jgi:hypothetical protein
MKKSIGYFLYIIPFHKTTITGRVVTNKQILSKTEAEEQWRKFYSYDKPDSETCPINNYPISWRVAIDNS